MGKEFHRPYRGAMDRIPYDELAVADLVKSVARFDGHPPLSANKLRTLTGSQAIAGVWSEGGNLCVVAVAAFHESGGHWAVEIAVAPAHRDERAEEAALRLGRDLIPDRAAHSLWAFRSGQIEAAERLGYREVRSVLRVTGPIPVHRDERPRRTTINAMKPEDVDAIIALNNRAFAGHPEQGAMTATSFASLFDQPGMDPTGVLVARSGERINGFCITKSHTSGNGEIFLIAVDPVDHHQGIGREMINEGFSVLKAGGACTAEVWVDRENEAAVGLYASLGLAEDFRTRELVLS